MADTLHSWGPANVDTLLTTTMEKRRKSKGIHDNIFNEMVVLSHLYDKKKVTEDGGATLLVPIMYEANNTAQFFDGYEQLDTTPQEGHTTGQYQWKQAAVSVSVSDKEENVQNQGPSAVFRIVDAKSKQAELSLRDLINAGFFTASPASKAVGSLVTTIDATSNIGEINSTTYSWWQSTVTTGGSFAAQGLADMRDTWNTVSQKTPGGGPDLIVTTATVYGYYEGTLQPQQRYSGKVGDGSFENLLFKSAPVTHDADCTSGVMYFLDSRALEYVVKSGRDFVMTPFVKPSNQIAKVAQFMVVGELVTSNRRKLSKITSITA
jgi:hypothetical protein